MPHSLDSRICDQFCRPTVKDLLNEEFFLEDVGLKVELVSREEAVISDSSKVELRLRVLDPKKRKDKHKENEAIQFEFDIQMDNIDEMAAGMVSNSAQFRNRKPSLTLKVTEKYFMQKCFPVEAIGMGTPFLHTNMPNICLINEQRLG